MARAGVPPLAPFTGLILGFAVLSVSCQTCDDAGSSVSTTGIIGNTASQGLLNGVSYRCEQFVTAFGVTWAYEKSLTADVSAFSPMPTDLPCSKA